MKTFVIAAMLCTVSSVAFATSPKPPATCQGNCPTTTTTTPSTTINSSPSATAGAIAGAAAVSGSKSNAIGIGKGGAGGAGGNGGLGGAGGIGQGGNATGGAATASQRQRQRQNQANRQDTTVNQSVQAGTYNKDRLQAPGLAVGFSSGTCVPYGFGATGPGAGLVFQHPDNYGTCPTLQVADALVKMGCRNAALAVLADVPRNQAIRDNPCEGQVTVLRRKY